MNMQVHNNISFKGYDARRLRGFIMLSNFKNIATELTDIGRKEGFDVFLVNPKNVTGNPEPNKKFKGEWTQDLIGIIGQTVTTLLEADAKEISKMLNLKVSKFQQRLHKKLNIEDANKHYLSLLKAKSLKGNQFKYLQLNGHESNLSFSELNRLKLYYKRKRHKLHISGGNYFIVKDANGKDKILAGEDTKRNFIGKSIVSLFKNPDITFKKDDITFLPQADFHIDLFIRPLDKQRVLIADDKMTLKMLESGIQKTKSKLADLSPLDSAKKEKLNELLTKLNNLKINFEEEVNLNPHIQKALTTTKNTLQNLGFETINVPGRYYNYFSDIHGGKSPSHMMNFMNANVLTKENGELVYITNHSYLDELLGLTPELQQELNFGTERTFIKTLEPYVKKEHIYFVSGDDLEIPQVLLPYLGGGIHCLSSEVPKII